MNDKTHRGRLATDIGQLKLGDPFMIASSHWTDSRNALLELKNYRPCAVTLKTISIADGGSELGGARRRASLEYPLHGSFGAFTDGSKRRELVNAVGHKDLLREATSIFDHRTAIGISVRAGENYKQAAASIVMTRISFVELNWKYTFRGLNASSIGQGFEDARKDVEAFRSVFSNVPWIVKVPHEMLPFLPFDFALRLFGEVKKAGGILLVANTMRSSLPPSRYKHGKDAKLGAKGVVFGEPLFLHTFNALLTLKELEHAGNEIPPRIATGGITDIGAVIDVMAAGASAVQLCRALDKPYGVKHLNTLRNQLRFVSRKYGVSLDELRARLTSDEAFWMEVAALARSVESDPESVLELVRSRSTQEKLSQVYEDVIAIESDLKQAKVKLPEAVSGPDSDFELEKHTFALNRAVVATLAVGRLVDERLPFRQEQFDSGTAFRQLIKSGDYTYAIIPRSLFDSIAYTDALKDLPSRPEIVGDVGLSCVELVGVDKDVELVYYFPGVTATSALVKLEQVSPAPKRVNEPISTQDLTPILNFWYDKHAIVGRAPLTRIFPLLNQNGLFKRWQVLQNLHEPLVLVVNATYAMKNAGDVHDRRNRWVYASVLSLMHEIHLHPQAAARSVVTSGYLAHIANFLGATVMVY